METYKTKNGECRYKEKIRMPSGELITKSFRRKTDANVWKRKMLTEKDQGVLGSSTVETIVFAELARRWFAARVENILAYKTIQLYRHTLNATVLPGVGKLLADKVTMAHIEGMKSALLRSGLKPRTINRVMTMVRQILLYGVDEGYVRALPFTRALHLRVDQTQVNYFTEGEVTALLRTNLLHPIYPVLFLALHTGMRLGEILGLRWDRVNFDTGQIEITRTLHRGGFLQEKPKGKRARYFPMNDDLRAFLLDLRRKQPAEFVFANKRGLSYNPDHFSGRNFKAACSRAGVRPLRFHDLRHTFASHFMMKGGNIFDLKELLGHKDIKDTMIYAHISPEHLRKASTIVNFNQHQEQVRAVGPSLALATSGD